MVGRPIPITEAIRLAERTLEEAEAKRIAYAESEAAKEGYDMAEYRIAELEQQLAERDAFINEYTNHRDDCCYWHESLAGPLCDCGYAGKMSNLEYGSVLSSYFKLNQELVTENDNLRLDNALNRAKLDQFEQALVGLEKRGTAPKVLKLLREALGEVGPAEVTEWFIKERLIEAIGEYLGKNVERPQIYKGRDTRMYEIALALADLYRVRGII